MRYNNLFEIIEANRENPIKIGVFYENYELKETLTNADTIERSEKFAGLIRKRLSIRNGSNVLISLDNQWEFIISFFACNLSQNVPVPVTPKTLLPKNEWSELVGGIFKNAEAELIITTEGSKKLLPEELQTKVLTIEELKSDHGERVAFHCHFHPQSKFFIQYSSGSTSNPKGVILTHENVITNLEQIKQGMGIDARVDSTLSWLPLHHDMGLIGMLFSAYFNVGTTYVMGPIDFIKSPYRWLKLASDLKVSIINSPNSGYHTCNSKITEEEIKSLDLSHIRVAMSGAEPINASVIETFQKKFSQSKLKEKVFFPVYGLAEATLAVSFPRLGEKVKVETLSFSGLTKNIAEETTDTDLDKIDIVCCGTPLKGTEILIKDENGSPLPDGIVGEIFIRGKSISQGYYKNSTEIISIKDKDEFCNTGDLGYLRQNHLFITGRKKDLIIINGKNISPHDLELKVSRIKPLRMGRIVIVSCQLPDSIKEKVFVIAECAILSKDRKKLLKHKVIEAIGNIVPLTEEQIFFIPPFFTKKTTSGKVRRFLMKELVIKGKIQRIEKEFLKHYLDSRLFILGFLVENINLKFWKKTR